MNKHWREIQYPECIKKYSDPFRISTFPIYLSIQMLCFDILLLLLIAKMLLQLDLSSIVVNGLDIIKKDPHLTISSLTIDGVCQTELSVDLQDITVSRHTSGERYKKINRTSLQGPENVCALTHLNNL